MYCTGSQYYMLIVLPADYKPLGHSTGGGHGRNMPGWASGILSPQWPNLGRREKCNNVRPPPAHHEWGSPVAAVPMWTGLDAGLTRDAHAYEYILGILSIYHPGTDSGTQTLEYAYHAYGLCELSIRPDQIGEASSASS